MTITGQQKISIYDPATGTVVQLNRIAEDGEFEKTGSYIQNSQGGRMYSGDESKAEFISYDWSGYDQLETWMRERTPVRFVTYGLDEHILWYEDTYITVDKKTSFTPYGRSGFTIYFQRTGGVHNIYKGSNILYAVNKWKDTGGDIIADGYSLYISYGDISKNFDNNTGYQRLDIEEETSFRFETYITYPIAGAAMSFFEMLGAATTINANIKAIQLDVSGNTLASTSKAFASIDDFTTSANIYQLRLLLIDNIVVTAGYSCALRDPYLGCVTSTRSIIKY